MTELQRINACAKRPIDIWTNYLYYPLSIRLVYILRNASWVSPNGITVFSLFLALCGCVFYFLGGSHHLWLGLLLVQISYVFDCADGQMARYRKQFSPFGGWIDQVADRIKEFAVYFSLAYGYTRMHPGNTQIWMWAMVALFALYLLEYYGQIQMKPLKKAVAPLGESNTSSASLQQALSSDPSTTSRPADVVPAAAASDTFTQMQRWRSLVPFRGFIIGEQYFAMLVFLIFGAIYPFFVFVALLGLLMAVYRPVIQVIKLFRDARA